MKVNYLKSKYGQAMIAILLVVALALIFITTTAVIYTSEADFSFNTRKSNEVYYNGEAALENAIIRIIRNPNYLGETLTLDDGSAIISVSIGPSPTQKTINIKSISNSHKFIRNIQAIIDTNNHVVSLVSWRENE
jgi:type II secretory pathway component PulK